MFLKVFDEILNNCVIRKLSSKESTFYFQQLEQEKHRLRCELEVMEEEYEQRITELQSDLSGNINNKINFRFLYITHALT